MNTPPIRGISTCTCGASITWAWTAASGGKKRMPLDAVPVDDGDLLLTRDMVGRAIVMHARPDDSKSEPRYKSHFATCPDAGKFRRHAPKGKPAARAR